MDISISPAKSSRRAVGDRSCDVQLSFDEKLSVAGFVNTGDQNRGLVVRQVTLDQYCEESGITDIRLIKMDIEGSELHALQGAGRLFGERRVDFCYFEVNELALRRRGVSIGELIGFFRTRGYGVFWPHTAANGANASRPPSIHRVQGGIPFEVARFEPDHLEEGVDHQFDLLAVAPHVPTVGHGE